MLPSLSRTCGGEAARAGIEDVEAPVAVEVVPAEEPRHPAIDVVDLERSACCHIIRASSRSGICFTVPIRPIMSSLIQVAESGLERCRTRGSPLGV